VNKAIRAIIAILVSVALVLAGLYFYNQNQRRNCRIAEARESLLQFRPLIAQFNDAISSVEGLGGASLIDPIARMETIRDAVKLVRVPKCLELAKSEIVMGMDDDIASINAIRLGESQSKADSLMASGIQHFQNANKEIERVGKCAPTC